MRRASFERYFGGRIRGIFLCAWILLRSASQPTSHQRTPNPRDVVFGERWWIPTEAISVVLMCGVVSSVYMRLKQIFSFLFSIFNYSTEGNRFEPIFSTFFSFYQFLVCSLHCSPRSFLSNLSSPRSTSCGRRPSPQRALAIALGWWARKPRTQLLDGRNTTDAKFCLKAKNHLDRTSVQCSLD